jgi:hypothetical protein
MFRAPGPVFAGTVGVVTRFEVLCSRTRFRRYRRRRAPLSCSALPDSFSALPRVSGPVFSFLRDRTLFGDSEDVGSRFHVLRSRTRFRRYRRRREQFSCFALPDPFSAVPTSSGPVYMFCGLGLIFGGSEGVVSHFHIFTL